jgi:ABC-2 type transport system ATP-binding protein
VKVIELKNVEKTYPGVRALKGISFSVEKGSIHGFLGPNGAGKTTTMNIIAGLSSATSGQVFIDGKELEREKSPIGFLPENPPLYLQMKVFEYLKFVAEINGVHKSEVGHRVLEIGKKCGLTKVMERLIGNLSKGYRQRVGIAQALVFDPKIVILDEPTVGLDPNSIMEIRELITSLKKDHTIMFSTHQLHEAHLICSHITIINQGAILKNGPIGEIGKSLKNRQVIRAVVRDWKLIEPKRLLKEVKEVFPCDEVEVADREGHTELRFIAETDDDLRPSVGAYLMQKNCGLLSFTEEGMDLEEIFKRSTGR